MRDKVFSIMKKVFPIIKVIMIFIIVVAICRFIYTLLYYYRYSHNFIKDWIIDNFIDNHRSPKNINYSDIGQLVYKVFLIFSLILVFSTYFISKIYARYLFKKRIKKISLLIKNYIKNTDESSELFTKDYSKIGEQIVQVKSSMDRQEKILKEESSRKNDLIVYLAHDLKTPLTSVIGYLSLINEIEDMPIKQKNKYIKITLQKAIKLESLINEFFDIIRYNLQQIEIEREEVDLSYMLVQMSDEFYPILNEHKNKVELSIDENIKIYVDPEKIARVFNNILKNAISYSYPKTIIKIWAEIKENKTIIYFQNSGKTIPKHKLNVIFEKFFRLDEARSTNTGGAGLGLAIAKEIVTLHGGEIKANSENGITTFAVLLAKEI